jgi:hypothetical protein
MAIIGVNFTKINVEKKDLAKGKININNNISIKDIKKKDLAPGKNINQKGLQFIFSFASKYEPKLAEIKLEGEVLFVGTNKVVEDVLKAWKKDKKPAKEIMTAVLNTALTKCNIQAIVLSQQVNLPPPIPLPRVGTKK